MCVSHWPILVILLFYYLCILFKMPFSVAATVPCNCSNLFKMMFLRRSVGGEKGRGGD
jgi:hypothetical protein